jgi:hypothetical protein
MALESIRSISPPASLRGRSLAQRGAGYFGMSGPVEFAAAASLFALMIVLKLVNMTTYGFVQYRDVFDNHMPLFQIMFAPVFGLIGDRATILYWMRFILLPMYFVGAWCTYRIGELLFSRRAGVWAIILAGLFSKYHFASFEFRTDNLWAPLWLLCVLTLISGSLTVPRALKAGLLLGLCFSVSMKSVLLLVTIVVGASIALFLVGRKELGQSWSHLARCAAAFFFTTFLVPGIIAVAFALGGLWHDFYYCNFEHNILPHLSPKNHPAWWIFIFPIVFPLAIYAALLIVRAAPEPALAFRRGFIFLICGFYSPALYSFWNLLTRQDDLPYYPLAFVLYSGGLLAISPYFARYGSRIGRYLRCIPLPAFVALLELFLLIASRPFWIDRARLETGLLRGVLKLTDPGDFVLDCKGETIFRQRCFWPVTESIMLERIARHLVADDAAQRAVETRACAAAMKGRMPFRARKFIWENYISVGNDLRVAGRFLRPSATDATRMEFEVVIPASYKIVARDGPVTGMLDGTPYEGARFLAPGVHSFVQTSSRTQLAALWARAVDRNFLPEKYFPPRPK